MDRRVILKAASSLLLAAPILNAKPKFEWIVVRGRTTKCSVIVPQEFISKNNIKELMKFYNYAMLKALKERKDPDEILVLQASFVFSEEFLKAIRESTLPSPKVRTANPSSAS